MFRQDRWIYDVAAYTVGEGQLGIASSQSGGMAGEPENLIRLWRLGSRDDATLQMRLNTEGADPSTSSAAGPEVFCHRRGVHALEYTQGTALAQWGAGGVLLSSSEDLVAAWAMDAQTGRGREAARAPSPLDGSPECIRLCADGVSVVCAGRVVPGRGLPVLDLGAGLVCIYYIYI